MKGARPRSAGARAEATRGPRRPAEPPARSRSMTMTRWSNGADGRRRGDSLWTLRSDDTGKKAGTATRGSLLVDGSHAGQRQQNRGANSLLRPDLKAGSRTTRAIIPRATSSGYFPGRSAQMMRGHAWHLTGRGCRPRRTSFPWVLRSEPSSSRAGKQAPQGRRDTPYVFHEVRGRSQSHKVAGKNSRVRRWASSPKGAITLTSGGLTGGQCLV